MKWDKLLNDFKKACSPQSITVSGDFNPRGGIKTDILSGDNI